MVGSIKIDEQEKEIIVPAMMKYLEDNKDKTVEVPVNLMVTLSLFLKASSWYSDMNEMPYPTFENISHLFSHLIKDHLIEKNVEKHPRFGIEPYTVFKMLGKCQWDEEDFKNLLKWGEKNG